LAKAGAGNGTWHPPNHAARLVLCHCSAACRDQRLGSNEAVMAHSGQHQHEDFAFAGGRCGPKHRIDGRTTEIFSRSVIQFRAKPFRTSYDQQVTATRGNVYPAALQWGTIDSLCAWQAPQSCQLIGQQRCEARWHMLGQYGRNAKAFRPKLL
jgi:hypothetical protein